MNQPQRRSSFDDHIPLSRLILRYAVTGLVTLMIVSVVTAYVSRGLGNSEAIYDADRLARLTATAAIEPALDDDLLTMDPEAIAKLDSVVRNRLLVGSIQRVKIWTRDGTIVYSDEGRLIGEHFELDDDALAILDGPENGSKTEISDLSEPENRYESPAVQLLEVYAPITTPSGERLLYEAYFRYEGVAEAGRRAWLRFAPVTLGSLLLLGVLQVPLVVSLARRLRHTQEQREQLLQRAIQATDAERRRIASDLHDGVVQDLAGAGFALAATARRMEGPQGDDVRRAGEQVRDAVRSLRSLLVEIYPPNLYEEGLEAALSDLMAKLEPRGVAGTLAVDSTLAPLSLDATQLIYRAAQEGLRNVVAHADATHVDVSVTNAAGQVVLRVADDGRGMGVARVPDEEGHFGLRALGGLAASMGATLSLESAPGAGTVLRLEVPVG